ncbi:MAG TPA: autotransporter-associated beta strand repeat-containing protein [Rariglobus sp.]
MKIVTPRYSFTFARSLALGTGCFIAALSSAQAADFTATGNGSWGGTNTATWSFTGTDDGTDGIPGGTDNIVGSTVNATQSTVSGSQSVNNFTFASTGTTNSWELLNNTLAIGGAITKSGTGSLTFRSTMTLTVGSIAHSGGTINFGTNTSTGRQLTSLSVGSVAITNNASMSFYVGTGSTTATLGALSLDNTAVVNIRQASATTDTAGTLQVASLSSASTTTTVRVTGNTTANTTGTLQINSTANASYAGLLVNGSSGALSVSKSGGFTQTLSGNSNTYSGGTTISGGMLLVTNTTGSATGTGAVAVNGGTLGGTGFVDGATAVTGGNLAAGTDGTVGTLTFNGTLDIAGLSGTGQLKFDLGAVGASDKIVANAFSFGTGVLNFDDFDFVAVSGFAEGTFTLFDSATSISASSLGSSLTGTINGLAAELSISGDDLILTVVAIPEPSSYAVLAGALALSGAAFRRRRS